MGLRHRLVSLPVGRRPARAARLAAVSLACLSFAASPVRAGKDEQVPVFEKSVQPLFSAKCSRCHGAKTKKADLDLSTAAGIRKGSESGPVIVPGKPAESRLYEMIHEGKMPPGKKDPLGPAEVESIRRWIETGARFRAAASLSS